MRMTKKTTIEIVHGTIGFAEALEALNHLSSVIESTSAHRLVHTEDAPEYSMQITTESINEK